MIQSLGHGLRINKYIPAFVYRVFFGIFEHQDANFNKSVILTEARRCERKV